MLDIYELGAAKVAAQKEYWRLRELNVGCLSPHELVDHDIALQRADNLRSATLRAYRKAVSKAGAI